MAVAFPPTISAAIAAMDSGVLSAHALCMRILDRIDRYETSIGAYIALRDPELVLAEASAVDRRRQAGEHVGELAGIPVGIKDSFATADMTTTVGSPLFASWRPEHDADTVARLRAADAIIVGKLNLDELQDGSSTDNPHFGRTLNPWNRSLPSGGSSGGSGAAVAAGLCLGATGSDAGGSIRNPASLCGVVGLKPTFGRVSVHGVAPLTWTLAHAGPIARTGEDAYRMLRVMAGHDPRDRASAKDAAVTDSFRRPETLESVVIGVDRTYFTAGIEESVRLAFEAALAKAESLGARVVELRMPWLDASTWVENAILYPEGASVFGPWLDADPQRLSRDVRRRLLSGRLYRSQAYAQAMAIRAEIRHAIDTAFESVTVLASPTLPIESPGWSDDGRFGFENDPETAVFERNVVPFNISGHPAVSVPCGCGPRGIPIGLQLAGRSMADVKLLEIADTLRLELGTPADLGSDVPA